MSIKEGEVGKLKRRLALIKDVTSVDGNAYPKLITWLDDEKKCAECGKVSEEHDQYIAHNFVNSVNEVYHLYERMKGLVIVKFKAD